MEIEAIRVPNIQTVEKYIKECEGKHVQQVVYSTYHKALTQICFGCKKIRTNIDIETWDKLNNSQSHGGKS